MLGVGRLVEMAEEGLLWLREVVRLLKEIKRLLERRENEP